MKLKAIIIIYFSIATAQAGSRAHIQLVGIVPVISQTQIQQKRESRNHFKWLIQHSHNSYNVHSQKIEVEGAPEKSVEKKIVATTDDNYFIRHEILLDLVSNESVSMGPVYLRITAN